ncbi:nucleolar protein 12-domain-containing protein [Lyophyllum atratum]|nr:nucleolar protein 12-domain-containing protein [Lyophyllum atratum]
MQNLAILTQSHKAIAAKKKAKRDQIKEVLFDDDARREFLTGFHKRKVAKADAARKKAVEREKQERLETRREQRRMLRERAVENAAEVESAYHALLGNVDDVAEDDWTGISSEQKGKRKEEEYEDEEITATVTVVEDFDPDSFIHGPRIPTDSEKRQPSAIATQTATINPSTSRDNALPKKKMKAKKIRYQTKEERKVERTKQRARRTEKAELAGGKASRKKGASKRKGGR